MTKPSFIESLVVGATLAGFAGIVASFIGRGLPFGWDESVYALTARAWLHGTPDTGYGPWRSPGLPALLTPALLVGDSEVVLRAAALPLALAAIAGTWLVARFAGGSTVAAFATVLVSTCPPMLQHSAELLGDVPSLALLLGAMALLWREMELEERPSLWLLGVPLLFAAAFYLRYGNVTAIGLVILATAWVWRDRLRPCQRELLTSAILFSVLIAPFVVHSSQFAGSPWGLARYSVRGEYSAQGLKNFLFLQWQFGGPLVCALIVLGFLWLVSTSIFPSTPRMRRVSVFLGLPAVGQVVAIGLLSQGEARYYLLSAVLLTILGLVAAVSTLRRLHRVGQYAVATLATCALIVSVIQNVKTASARYGVTHRGFEIVRMVGSSIRDLSEGGDCMVIADRIPQFTWYSSCATYDPARTGREEMDGLGEMKSYLVAFERRSHVLPPGTELGVEILRMETPGSPYGEASVFTLLNK